MLNNLKKAFCTSLILIAVIVLSNFLYAQYLQYLNESELIEKTIAQELLKPYYTGLVKLVPSSYTLETVDVSQYTYSEEWFAYKLPSKELIADGLYAQRYYTPEWYAYFTVYEPETAQACMWFFENILKPNLTSLLQSYYENNNDPYIQHLFENSFTLNQLVIGECDETWGGFDDAWRWLDEHVIPLSPPSVENGWQQFKENIWLAEIYTVDKRLIVVLDATKNSSKEDFLWLIDVYLRRKAIEAKVYLWAQEFYLLPYNHKKALSSRRYIGLYEQYQGYKEDI